MADISIRFKLRRGTAANLASVNETPLAGELVVETDTSKAKLGDGTTAWNSLPYWNAGGVASFNSRTGAVVLTSGDVTGALGFTPAQSGAITGSSLTMATTRLLGRTTASTGAVEEISLGRGLTLASGSLSASASVIAQSAVASPVTGTTSETTLATITVPANAMGANGRIEITTMWSTTNSANNKTLRVKFGSLTMQSIVMTTNASIQVTAIIANRNNTASQVASPNSSTGSGATTNAVQTAAIDTTAAVTILLTGQLANAGETITLEAYSVKLFT